MATTTKSSKAKTKTTKAKKPAAKKPTSKNTSVKSAKSTSKSTATKVVVSKKTITTKDSKKSKEPKTRLQKLYAISIVVYGLIAVAAYFLMSNLSFQLSVGYWGKDELNSVNGTQFAPATQGIVDVHIKWIVIVLAVVSIVLPVLYLTRFKKDHDDSIKAKVMPKRWIEMAITFAIMVETVAMLSGVLDIATLKLIGGFMIVTMIAGWMAEKRTVETGKAAIREYYLGLITGILPWLVIISYAIFTIVFGDIRATWFVYALYVVLVVSASIIGKNQLLALKRVGKFANYEAVQENYVFISLILRVLFSVVLIIGLYSR
ncbi:MAG: hypothetical protein U0451_01475 [Candidatus Saccharimonadales bacterium]